MGIWLCDNESLVDICNDDNIPLENLLPDPMEESDKNYYKYSFNFTLKRDVLHQVIENKYLIPLVVKWISLHQEKTKILQAFIRSSVFFGQIIWQKIYLLLH